MSLPIEPDRLLPPAHSYTAPASPDRASGRRARASFGFLLLFEEPQAFPNGGVVTFAAVLLESVEESNEWGFSKFHGSNDRLWHDSLLTVCDIVLHGCYTLVKRKKRRTQKKLALC